MTLDRKDYKSAIPQLEGRLAKIEKLGKDVFNKFEDIAHKTQLDAAEAEKKVAALDYQIDSINVVTEYQLQTNGQDPVEANWSTTMPSITYSSYNGKTLWCRSVTYQNDIAIRKTAPQIVQLMDGLYTFVNSASGNTGWTMIDGDFIQTGKIASTNGYSYFDIDNNAFQMKDSYDVAHSDSVLAWQNGLLYVKGKIAVGTGDNSKYYTEMTGGGFDIVANDVNLAHIGYGEGNASSGTATAPYFLFGMDFTPVGVQPYDSTRAYSVGELCTYDNKVYIAWRKMSATGWNANRDNWHLLHGNNSFTNGRGNIAAGWNSHAEGYETKALHNDDHSEGIQTVASGGESHAEGNTSKTYAMCSHVEGYHCLIDELSHYGHAEGFENEIRYAMYAHVQGRNNQAHGACQTVIGRYNDNDSTYNAFEIGNGSENGRSNAFEVEWNGDVEIAGTIRTTSNKALFAHGSTTITPSANNTPTKKSITFSPAFASTPNVVVTAQTSAPGTTVTGVGVSNISTTGCDIYVTRTNTTDTVVQWIAMCI